MAEIDLGKNSNPIHFIFSFSPQPPVPHLSASIPFTEIPSPKISAQAMINFTKFFPKQFSRKFFPELSQKTFPIIAMKVRFAIFRKCRIAPFARFLHPSPTSCSRPCGKFYKNPKKWSGLRRKILSFKKIYLAVRFPREYYLLDHATSAPWFKVTHP